MIAIFDKSSLLCGWFDGKNIFDLNMSWTAFVSGVNVFQSSTVAWLGPINDGSFLDRDGKPVAWMSNAQPSGTLKPLTPLKPLKPLKPLTPLKPLKPLKPLTRLTPVGGWSKLGYQEWIGGS